MHIHTTAVDVTVLRASGLMLVFKTQATQLLTLESSTQTKTQKRKKEIKIKARMLEMPILGHWDFVTWNPSDSVCK